MRKVKLGWYVWMLRSERKSQHKDPGSKSEPGAPYALLWFVKVGKPASSPLIFGATCRHRLMQTKKNVAPTKIAPRVATQYAATGQVGHLFSGASCL
jgi:hypothetical protein